MRNNCITDNDISLLETRLSSNLPSEEVALFFNSPHIYATNLQAEKWTMHYLLKQNIPIRRVKPVLTPDCPNCALNYRTCYLGQGIKVSVSRNLCQVANLINSSSCTVVDILYGRDTDEMPRIVFVRCPTYTGPTLAEGCIPIAPVSEFGFCRHYNRKYQVSYIPLRNVEGQTAYFSQSQSYDRVVFCFDGFRRDIRAIYTGISRTVRLSHLLLISSRPLREYFVS